MHPTTKPVAMLADALRDCSKRGAIVLDPFGGSGSTLIAAEKTGRHVRLIELDPAYVDVTIRRWQVYAGKPGTLAASGETFELVAEQRSCPRVAAYAPSAETQDAINANQVS